MGLSPGDFECMGEWHPESCRALPSETRAHSQTMRKALIESHPLQSAVVVYFLLFASKLAQSFFLLPLKLT
jgi:hypothetical protein